MTEPRDLAFERLLEFVRDARGFDFTGYKRPSLMRRLQRRMEAVGLETYDEYRTYLEGEPDEFVDLFNSILINVTAFFRDSEAWEFLGQEVIPQLLENAPRGSQLRLWSAGCSSGEEAYTMAMLFAHALGDDEFRNRIKIYATDVDEEALAQARQATYTQKQVSAVPPDLRERYFQPVDHGYVLRGELRRCVIFGRNDLLQDAPISRVDLLVSRNTLMYFEPDAQRRILSNFAFALKRRGFLMVGKAEALQSRTDLFEPFDLKRRVFVRNPGAELPMRERPAVPRLEPETDEVEGGSLTAAAFEQAPVAEVVVDPTGRVAALNHGARLMFGLKQEDLGRRLRDLELSYRPIDLPSSIEQTAAEGRAVRIPDVAWPSRNGDRSLDVQVSPLVSSSGEPLGVSVSFTDVTRFRGLQDDLETARRSLETAYEELQSTVEELETTNEELQSTNEELETMNEELQSTNEELETMNDELRERTDEVLRTSAFLSSILANIHQAVIVVDRQLRVAAWSRPAADLWGLRADEAEGENFLNLDIGLPVGELRTAIRAVLTGDEPEDLVVHGHNRRGQPVVCTVSFTPLRTFRDDVEGAILVMSAEREGAAV